MDRCVFETRFQCSHKKEKLSTAGPKRITTIIRYSKDYDDEIHSWLQTQLDSDSNYSVQCHRSCVSTYTSPLHRKRSLLGKRSAHDDSQLPQTSKCLRRSVECSFNFEKHCIFCSKECSLKRDYKNPNRWRPAYVVRQVESGKSGQTLTNLILAECDTRGPHDEWASKVRIRVQGAISDLHAADACYHVDCKRDFLYNQVGMTMPTAADATDHAFESVIKLVQSDATRIWNSVELYQTYHENGGNTMSRRILLSRLGDRFGDEILTLSSPGIASIVIFKSRTADLLKLVPDEDDDLNSSISTVSKHILKETKSMSLDTNYNTRIDKDIAQRSVCRTVQTLLTSLSPKLCSTLPALLVGNIITSVLRKQATCLQTALGILVRDSKAVVNQFHDFQVTCSYDEVLRFKKSAAVAQTKKPGLGGIRDNRAGLIQVVADNFDADISSQNGKLSTHSLALIVTQPATTDNEFNRESTERLHRISKSEMVHAIEHNVPIERYTGGKKPEMPAEISKQAILPLKVLAQAAVSRKQASELDISFLKEVHLVDKCPEYNGYNTKLSREDENTSRPMTMTSYQPLIDMPPADPDTMMTALVEAQRITAQTGQEYTVFTCDQQLYRVALDVMWVYPDRFSNVILRLGGMHLLMSFIGSIGTLMADTGLSDVLESVFGGVGKMLTGKKFPQNVRALRLIVEEILRDVLLNHPQLSTTDELLLELERRSLLSKTTKLWVDVLIKPVLLTLKYVRAEREGDWSLHLDTVYQMIPYFFAARHVNYARYGLYYLESMKKMPKTMLGHFMAGEHVMRHIEGSWNGIWSDMFIETTFMRYGHGKGGIIGITLKPQTLKTWALSLHACSQIVGDIAHMGDENVSRRSQGLHKEEMNARIEVDGQDRLGLRKKLELCIDPLNPDGHPDSIVNIVSGCIAPSSVNVHDAVSIGKQQMDDFKRKWPAGFQETITKKVETMSVTRKHIKVGETNVIDTNIIYQRIMGLQASSREVDLESVLSYELAPVATSMFTDAGDLRIATSKSTMKKLLQVEISSRTAANSSSCTVIDGCALLWKPHWPANGKVKDFVESFKKHVSKLLLNGDVYLVFDRYREYSTKSVTRHARAGKEASRVHQLNLNTELVAQRAVLHVTKNKVQLIDIICRDLKNDEEFHKLHTKHHRLVITGQTNTPLEICNCAVHLRHEMTTSHEEADTIIVQQAITLAKQDNVGVTVLCDDTDVFLLLLHHYAEQSLVSPCIMESVVQGRAVIDIRATVHAHAQIIPDILAAHALSGCDTVASYLGIGKGKVLKTLRAGHSLSLLGNVSADISHVIKQANTFIATCYGQTQSVTMSEARVKVWAVRTGTGTGSTPKLSALPPTTEAFVENVRRAHLQTYVWKQALVLQPVDLDPTQYGWKKDETTKSLLPSVVPSNVAVAPTDILQLIKCSCSTDTPCKTMKCRCNKSRLPCTVFCVCRATNCYNSSTGPTEGEVQ